MCVKVCLCFLVLQLLAFCVCTKETNGKREGFKSTEQEVVIVTTASVSPTENATSGAADKIIKASSTSKAKKSLRRRKVSSSSMARSLKLACAKLRKFASSSKYVKDMQGNVSAELLSRELKQLDSGEPCSFTPYSAALKVFLKACSIVETCPYSSSSPSYKFILPNGGHSTNGERTPPRITQLYIVVPTVFSPGVVSLNSRTRNRASQLLPKPETVVNYSNLPASIPSWLPAQQPSYRSVASRHQPRPAMVTLPPVARTTTEFEGLD